MKIEEDIGEQKAEESQIEEEEVALLLLIEHRSKEVERNKSQVSHFTIQLEKSEKLLEDAKAKLSRLRDNTMSLQKTKSDDGVITEKVKQMLVSPTHIFSDSSEDSEMSSKNPQGDVKCEQEASSKTFVERREGSFRKRVQSRPQIILPAANVKPFQSLATHKDSKASNGSKSRPTESVSTRIDSTSQTHRRKRRRSPSNSEAVESQARVEKREPEENRNRDLSPLIGRSSSAQTMNFPTVSFISSQHKRRLRSLVLCPTNDHLFVTSALNGVVNLWQVQDSGASAKIISSIDCVSNKQRRWPEDIAWHPHGNRLVSVYSADGGDSQVAVLDPDRVKEKNCMNYLEEKPHVKGNINNIVFMPWKDTCFATAGTDHAVVLWTENDGKSKWKTNVLHQNLHSSAVMGVAGMQRKQLVVSAGADKKIIGFDVVAEKVDYKHQMDNKCMGILPNPLDLNLFMVQTGTPRRQLRLFDYRVKESEIHAFGWEQESSESQSALISQAWSPDGLYVTSGSADPLIHIFDIRFNSPIPALSLKGHTKRVFKAVWLHSLPLLISISSDLNIGLFGLK